MAMIQYEGETMTDTRQDPVALALVIESELTMLRADNADLKEANAQLRAAFQRYNDRAAMLEEYIRLNIEDDVINAYLMEIAELFDIALTETREVTYTATYTGTIEVPIGVDEGTIEDAICPDSTIEFDQPIIDGSLFLDSCHVEIGDRV